jgi:hypothetical protein
MLSDGGPGVVRAGCGGLDVSEKSKSRRFRTAIFTVEAITVAIMYIWILDWVISWCGHPK